MTIRHTVLFSVVLVLCTLAVSNNLLFCWNSVGAYDATVSVGNQGNLGGIAQRRQKMLTTIEAAEEAADALKEALLQAPNSQQLSKDNFALMNQLSRNARISADQARGAVKGGSLDEAMTFITQLNGFVGQLEEMYNKLQPSERSELPA